MFRRHRSSTSIHLPLTTHEQRRSRNETENQRESQRNVDTETPRSSRELLNMGQNHIVAFLGFMYILLLICRFGWGWTPGRDPPISMDMIPIPMQNVTIVSALFDIPSKLASPDNVPSIQRFLTLKDNMMIFTSPNHIAESRRKALQTSTQHCDRAHLSR